MSSRKPTQAFDVRAAPRLQGWQVAISIGAALVIAPVMALVLVVLLAAVIPVLPFLLTLFLGIWGNGQRHRPPGEARSALQRPRDRAVGTAPIASIAHETDLHDRVHATTRVINARTRFSEPRARPTLSAIAPSRSSLRPLDS
jgi:hypothetical protein